VGRTPETLLPFQTQRKAHVRGRREGPVRAVRHKRGTASGTDSDSGEPRVSSLRWYVGRAAAMSLSELGWRARTATGSAAGLRRPALQKDRKMLSAASCSDWDQLLEAFRQGNARPVFLDVKRLSSVLAERPGAVEAVTAEADRLASGKRQYFGYPTADIGSNIDWNHDPVTGYRWPTVRSCKINHRSAGADPKWIWELNRLQHLPILAQAWMFHGRDDLARRAFDDLDSWIEQNPVGVGIAWRGPFEAGIRAISVSIALQGLRDSPYLTGPRYRRVVQMLAASARYCWRERSRFSSANNHLIGELAGVITVCLVLPELFMSAPVLPLAVDALASEADRQILADGAGAEQAVSYQMFSCELIALVVALLKLNGSAVPEQLTRALERSSRYLAAVVGEDDPDPRYGDDDDGFALRLGAESKRTVRDHLAIISAVLDDEELGQSGADPLMAAWFALGSACRDQSLGGARRQVPDGGSFYAPDGGLVVLRSGQRRFTMDVGPLGYLSIAAHGHADALAVTLSCSGRELIVDPGAGSYYGNPSWRMVHRSTSAHATVSVDQQNQSEMGGPFYWGRHANSAVRAVDLVHGVVDAQHDGYQCLDDPVVHRRWLVAPPGDGTALVVDLLDAAALHEYVVSWPLHPDLDAESTRDGYVVTCGGSTVLQLAYAATSAFECRQVRGDADNQLGWWSDKLESRRPAWLLSTVSKTAGPFAMLTVVHTGDSVAISDASLKREGSFLIAGWREGERARELRLAIDETAAVTSPDPAALRMVSAK
jgi:Heparinase II/III-like protein/Heparinase II/III N-terminus